MSAAARPELEVAVGGGGGLGGGVGGVTAEVTEAAVAVKKVDISTSKPRFEVFKKIFMPWKWKKKTKSAKFTAISQQLERKMSVRISKSQLVEMGLIPPSYSDFVSSTEPFPQSGDNPCHEEMSWVEGVGVVPPPAMFSPTLTESGLCSPGSDHSWGAGLDLSLSPGSVLGKTEELNISLSSGSMLSSSPPGLTQASPLSPASVVTAVMRGQQADPVAGQECKQGDEVPPSPARRESVMSETGEEVDGTVQQVGGVTAGQLGREEWEQRRERISSALERRLSTRPTAEELQARGVLPDKAALINTDDE